jgi:hypothetical protein
MADDLEAKRQTAAYSRTVAWLRHSRPDMSDAEMDAAGLAANDAAVYGHDAKKDRNGNWLEQGIGSRGHETSNHFASLLRYQGREAWESAVREIYKRDPTRAQKLGLPQPART